MNQFPSKRAEELFKAMVERSANLEFPIKHPISNLRLINNFNEGKCDYGLREDQGRRGVGIGLEWVRDGEYERAMVLMPLNPSGKDIEEAWGMLANVFRTGDGIVRGEERLTGKELRVSSMDHESANL